MLPLLALAVLQHEGRVTKDTNLDGLLGKDSLLIQVPVERLKRPKLSPKQGWEFDWTVAGYVGNANQKEMRFDVYSQESTQSSLRAESVTRTLLRLASFNKARMRLDHAAEFSKIVQVYLCYGGEPGGEQLFDVDKGLDGAKVNTIYLYDLRSFTDPVEAAREVAHEYGHAVLPPVGGDYAAPEAWANGYLGEKLYLGYLADARETGQIGPEDTFGATPAVLRAWVRKNVDPLVEKALTDGPQAKALAGKDKAAMDAFFGLALATARLYNPVALHRALLVAGGDPKAFPDAASVASEEAHLYTLDVPASLHGKAIWLPLGKDPKKSRIMGASPIGNERRDGWVHVRVGSGPVVVRNDPE